VVCRSKGLIDVMLRLTLSCPQYTLNDESRTVSDRDASGRRKFFFGDLFRCSFGTLAPEEPVHYAAFYRRGEQTFESRRVRTGERKEHSPDEKISALKVKLFTALVKA